MNKEQIEKHLDFVRKDIDHLYFLLDHLMKENKVVPSRVHSLINKCESISNMFEMLLDSSEMEQPNTTASYAKVEQEREHKDIDSSSLANETVESSSSVIIEANEPKETKEEVVHVSEPSSPVVEEVKPTIEEVEPTVVEEKVIEKPATPLVAEPVPEKEIAPTVVHQEQVKEVSRVKRIYDSIQLDPAVVAYLDPKENRRIALNLNDRLMFVRDIFQGNMQMLDQTVEQLNSFQSEQEALACLSQVTDWQDDPVHHAFLEQVKRKFI